VYIIYYIKNGLLYVNIKIKPCMKVTYSILIC